MIKKKRFAIILALLLTVAIGISFPQLFYKNSGNSIAHGKVHAGTLENAFKLPYRGSNFKYFSPLSYFILGRNYVHSSAHTTVINSYAKCETHLPGIKFSIMDCSKKQGGRLWPHRTHQNGLSIDFMTPLVKNGKQKRFYDGIGIFSYLLNFDSEGKLNKHVSIDFETMAKHILLLDIEARKNGLKIKKVIFKINLKDNLYSTKSGAELKRRGIYFAKNLSPKIDKLHDDHYHIDFEFIE
ncbi:MAG TPA: replication initiation protein [Bacteroidales bacterium]|nr:replication initiation protein [Bacteroidales bacterium]